LEKKKLKLDDKMKSEIIVLIYFGKNGFEVEKIEKNVLLSCGKRHDTIEFVKKYF